MLPVASWANTVAGGSGDGDASGCLASCADSVVEIFSAGPCVAGPLAVAPVSRGPALGDACY